MVTKITKEKIAELSEAKQRYSIICMLIAKEVQKMDESLLPPYLKELTEKLKKVEAEHELAAQQLLLAAGITL